MSALRGKADIGWAAPRMSVFDHLRHRRFVVVQVIANLL